MRMMIYLLLACACVPSVYLIKQPRRINTDKTQICMEFSQIDFQFHLIINIENFDSSHALSSHPTILQLGCVFYNIQTNYIH